MSFFHWIYILSRNFVILRKSRCLAVFSFESNLSYVHVNNVNRFPITKKIFMYFLSPLEKRKWKKEIKSKKVQLHGRQLLVYFTATARWFILSLSLSTSLPFFRSLSLFFFSPSPTCELLLSWFLPSLWFLDATLPTLDTLQLSALLISCDLQDDYHTCPKI